MREDLFRILAELQQHHVDIVKTKSQSETHDFWKILERFDTLTSAAVKVEPILRKGAEFLPLLVATAQKVIS